MPRKSAPLYAVVVFSSAFVFGIGFFPQRLSAQEQVPEAASSPAPGTAAELPAFRVIRISGVLTSASGFAKSSLADGSTMEASGPRGVTFALYREQEGGAPLWMEQHNVLPDVQGRYTVLVGSTKPEGLPLEFFTTGEARWLGVQVSGEPEQPRILLVSVPYALKAADAETLGGKPLSAFVLAEPAPSRDREGAVPDGSQRKESSLPTAAVTGGTPNTLGKFDLDGVSLVDSSVREETNATSPNLLGGFSGNTVSGGVFAATISGGGQSTQTNRVTDDGGAVSGGINNQAGDGGSTTDKAFANVGGGQSNTASGRWATVAGGATNNASADKATVGGGDQNTASGDSATVPGGLLNVASGSFSFAAGRRAKANHQGAFVWADSTDADFASTATNQFLIRAAGGVGIGTNLPTVSLDVVGSMKASGNLILPNTASPATGVLTLGGVPFLHNFSPAAAAPPLSNTFVGMSAGNFTMGGPAFRDGWYNTGLGFQALSAVTTGSANTASGTLALQNNTTGTDNTANGSWALNTNTTSSGNTAMGAWALQFNTGSNNTASGSLALQFNTTGNQNTANGSQALYQNTIGSLNTASGAFALQNNTTGTENTAIGLSALRANTTGINNTAVGKGALANSDGIANTAVGRLALEFNTTGWNNTAMGALALRENISGVDNTAFGHFALRDNTTGDNNTALGRFAGVTGTEANANITGSNNTFIGYQAGPGVDGTTTPLTNATAIGANAVVSANNSLVLGSINGVNGATSGVNVGIGTTAPTQRLEVDGNLKLTGVGNGIIFPDNTVQTTAVTGGSGDITAVNAGVGLFGGGDTGDVTLSLAPVPCPGGQAVVALPVSCQPFATLGTNNFFGNQSINGSLNLTGSINSGFRVLSNATSPNLIGGFTGNSVIGGIVGATISGGGQGGQSNRVTDNFGVVGGGLNNQAGDNAGSIADRQFATVSGGRNNNAGGLDATVGGGGFNTASGGAATVPGGALNAAAGQFTFAAGFRAKANHVGSFVWGDSTNADIASSTFNQFTVRASGGVRFFSNGAATAGVVLPPGGGGWLAVSDRNLKENLQAVDGAELLERLGRIPIQSWNYQTQENSIRHIGPMAQDFYGAFGVGEDDRYINSVDADGVALAAAQQLYRLTQQKDVEIRELTRHLDDVMKQMQELQARMARLEAE